MRHTVRVHQLRDQLVSPAGLSGEYELLRVEAPKVGETMACDESQSSSPACNRAGAHQESLMLLTPQ